MDLSDLGRHGITSGPPTSPRLDAPTADRLQGLLAQIGAEIAVPLTAAIERINTLASTGRIERRSLRALRDEVEAARQAGMVGQQLTRFTSGRIRQSHERLQLADTVGHVLSHRQREAQARGTTLQPTLAPVEINVDASLLFGLLNATIDWALANTASAIEIGVEPRPSPGLARLTCRFTPQLPDHGNAEPHAAGSTAMDMLTWRLIEQTAWAMGLRADRRLDAGGAVLVFDFPRTVGTEAKLESALDADAGFPASMNSQPLAGSHLLVIASRREMRMQIRDALRHMSLIVDFVNSVDEAAAFCREGLPHAIVIEAIQSGARFAEFRREVCVDLPEFVFIEIVEEGRVFQMSGMGGIPARVGREVMAESLPAALMFELSKAL